LLVLGEGVLTEVAAGTQEIISSELCGDILEILCGLLLGGSASQLLKTEDGQPRNQ